MRPIGCSPDHILSHLLLQRVRVPMESIGQNPFRDTQKLRLQKVDVLTANYPDKIAQFPRNSIESSVGVGIAIAHDPVHRSGRADFPHPALTLGDDAKTAERIGMTDSRWWQLAVNQAPHPVPSDTALLAASRKHAVPSPAQLSPEGARTLLHDWSSAKTTGPVEALLV
jgi:hypothetical protein